MELPGEQKSALEKSLKSALERPPRWRNAPSPTPSMLDAPTTNDGRWKAMTKASYSPCVFRRDCFIGISGFINS